jgi:hypothetical protein
MPRIADYTVISDGVVNLAPNENHEFTFSVNSDMHAQSRTVLTWRAHWNADPESLTFRVGLNGSGDIFTYPHKLSHNICLLLQEVVNNNVVLPGGGNTVRFTVAGEQGRIAISDVVLYFQRDI